MWGLGMNGLPKEMSDYLNRMLLEEQADREAFAVELEGFSEADLMAFVPDVYQKSIYKIDYGRLKEKDIKLISFDIDDTISDSIWNKARGALPGVKVTMPKDAKNLFRDLKSMGFTVTLLTNTTAAIAEDVCEGLQADGYIARADKPETRNFERMMEIYHVEPMQMAHVGNNIRQDVAGGNRAGVTTCLVRRAGFSLKIFNAALKKLGIQTKGHLVRAKLLEYGLWRKHHKEIKGDQYYQLGELPKYQTKQAPFSSAQKNDMEAAAADLIQQVEADQDKTYTLEELQRNIHKNNESAGMRTLRNHLGDNIAFTGVWPDVKDERELEEAELLDGELSGYVFTVGGYTIRSAVCLYQDDEEADYTQRVPVGQDAIAQYREESWRMRGPGSGVREVQVVSARYNGAGSDGWQHICIAATSICWDESINFIAALKPVTSAPAEHEVVFIFKQYTGDSFGVAHWYKLSSDGNVAEYEEHPFDPESFETSWEE